MLMNLPMFRQLSYISPSTFIKTENCSYWLYLARLAGFPYVEQPQSEAAAIGSAFDIFIKDYIARKREMDAPFLDPTYAIKKVKVEGALEKGKEIALAYIKTPLIKHYLECKSLRLDQELYCTTSGVPILGQLDAIPDNVTADWKTRGFMATRNMSPTPGYIKRWDYNIKTDDLVEKPRHDNAGLPLEQINETWATQMTFYNWLLHNISDRPSWNHFIRMEEITRCNDTHWAFCLYETTVSTHFIHKIYKKLIELWENTMGKMYSCDIEVPKPHARKCEKYNTICEVAHRCKYYMETLGDKKKRMHYV